MIIYFRDEEKCHTTTERQCSTTYEQECSTTTVKVVLLKFKIYVTTFLLNDSLRYSLYSFIHSNL